MNRKDYIPIDIKNKVWNNHCIYPNNKEFTQCRTCENLVLIPQSIRKLNNVNYDLINIYVDGKEKELSGVAEFGHIISEYNGGETSEDNLIIQCKTCNTRNGFNDIDLNRIKIDSIMLDAQIEDNNNMLVNCDYCQYIIPTTNNLCKNKTVHNRSFCYIHLKN